MARRVMIARWWENVWLRRAAFLVANLAAILAVVDVGIVPVRALLAERDTRIAEQRALLARLQAIAAQEATVQAMSRRAGADTPHDEFLGGRNEGVIAADLQTRLKAMIDGAGCRLRSVQGLPAKADGAINYVGVHVELAGPIQSVQKAIHAVETSRPYLFVTAATMRPSPAAGRQDAQTEPTIDAQLDVVGAIAPDGGMR